MNAGIPVYLALETSCDDTCAAVLDSGGKVLSSVVSSQLVHGEYEGVVPELASREHLRLGPTAIRLALEKAGRGFADLRGVAVTQGPGLIGCLLVGLNLAKGISMARGIPIVGVNHIEGHLHAILAERPFAPPMVGLVASGGHTEILHVRDWGSYELLGSTRDDAAGEAFDKVAKLLGLSYPGGPIVDRTAREGRDVYGFPRAWMDLASGNLELSFSGLKTAVKVFVERETERHGRDILTDPRFLADVCASFQAALVDVLIAKLEVALRRTRAPRLLLAGGVACNSSLRSKAAALGQRLGVEAAFPSPRLCADNAVMIGLAAVPRLLAGEDDGMTLAACANLDDFPAFAAA
ncbi:MAG: tRNA (adenosine(37)-N6)-threonylcarbamoyltransferase complex transferase subunit TsaD [Candidatus Eisenbacteria bacterium]|nr:tRNA (adenosine(37)-N6)-threonylcarbamoyltransferase complex transferase subunit TsaD [Candidatus Eisenbacteria bacterium]